jgi:hypothetical protein
MNEDEPCRKPDKVGKLPKEHISLKDACPLPDTHENRQKVKKVIHCCFDKTKEERIQWADPEQIDPDTGDIRGMDLHHKAKKRGFANPMEMYMADKKDEEDKKIKESKNLKEENELLKKQLADLQKTTEERFNTIAVLLQDLQKNNKK